MNKKMCLIWTLVFLISLNFVNSIHDTMVGFSGTLLDTEGNRVITNHDITIVVTGSDTNCTSDILYNNTFSDSVVDGFFNITLGLFDDFNSSFNEDYYSCLYIDNIRTRGVWKTKLGQGQVEPEDLNNTANYLIGELNASNGNFEGKLDINKNITANSYHMNNGVGLVQNNLASYWMAKFLDGIGADGTGLFLNQV